jgi:hypothetical protein
MNSTPHRDRNHKISNLQLFSKYYIFISYDTYYKRNNLKDTTKREVLHRVLKDGLKDSSLFFDILVPCIRKLDLKKFS